VAESGKRPWRVIGLHHVGFAHHGADQPRLLGDLLGLPVEHQESADGFVERMLPVGEAYMQLLEATGPGYIDDFLRQRGRPGLHHVAFQVTDLDAAVQDLRGRGVRLVDPAPRPGGMSTRIAFIHPSACPGLLIELVEPIPGGSTGTNGPATGEQDGDRSGRQ
jgi:methylmalonyl-CoA/ethylmalonyl-CoA epimerase